MEVRCEVEVEETAAGGELNLLKKLFSSLALSRVPTARPRPHGNANGKTHRINANAIAKKLPPTRNIHRIVSSHTRQLCLAPTTGKAAVHMPSLYVAL